MTFLKRSLLSKPSNAFCEWVIGPIRVHGRFDVVFDAEGGESGASSLGLPIADPTMVIERRDRFVRSRSVWRAADGSDDDESPTGL